MSEVLTSLRRRGQPTAFVPAVFAACRCRSDQVVRSARDICVAFKGATPVALYLMSANSVNLKHAAEKTLGDGSVPFELYQGESLKYSTQSPRQALRIESQSKNSTLHLNLSADDGHIFVTSRRLVYVTVSKGDINSFLLEFHQASLLQFSHRLVSPWFGANYWEFLFHGSSAVEGGFPNEWFKGTIKFNDGGLFDFILVINALFNDVVNNADIDEELPRYES